jgi:hypothetical protein
MWISFNTLGCEVMLTPLEKAVLDMLLENQSELFVTIRQQLAHATVADRSFSGVGFFTTFVIPGDAPIRRDLPDMTIGDVSAKFPGLEHGAGFLLFIRDGAVRMLEGYTYDELWPTNTDEFTIHKQEAA